MDIEIQDQIFDRLIRNVEIARIQYETDMISYVDFEHEINNIKETGYTLYKCAVFDKCTQIALVDVLTHIKNTVVRHSY